MRLGKLLLRLCGLLLVFGASLELTTRIEDWVRFRTPFLSPYRSQSELIVRDKDGMHPRPNSRFQKWVINNLGFRGPDVTPLKATKTYRIVTAGASETFGLYESADREYPRQLEDTLNAELEGRRGCEGVIRRFEVLNAGFPGMSLPTVTQDIRNRLSRYAVDVVLYYPSPVQYLREELPRAAIPDSSGRPDGPPWSAPLYPRVWKHLSNRLVPGPIKAARRRLEVASKVRDRPVGWRFERIPDDRLATYGADLRELVGAIRAVGATPVLVTHANAFGAGPLSNPELLRRWQRSYPRATGPTILAFDSAAADVTRSVAADSGALLVDGRAILSTAAAPDIFGDHVHFTDRGAGILAGAIARTLEQGWRRREVQCNGPVRHVERTSSDVTHE